MASKINRKFFFQQVRTALFRGKLTQSQVAGMTAILDYWETTYKGVKDDRHLAYALATAYHETGYKMQPVAELGGNEYLRRKYDVTGDNPARAKRMGNTQPGDGVKYAGEGLVQLTWKTNYEFVGKKLKVDLVGNPDLARDPVVAVAVLLNGMKEGWFTGKKFSDYLVGEKTDFRNARRIINGIDDADKIAKEATAFYAAISYTV